MAEGFLRHMTDRDFISASAGVDTAPVHPLAIEMMEEVGTRSQRNSAKTRPKC